MKKVNIIIADDQIDIISNLLENLKKQQNFNIVGVAYNGLELLNFLRTVPADFVITDNQMPKMTGLEAIKIIKKEKRDIPKIFVISADMLFSECNALDVQFIQKPINISKLINIINDEIGYSEDKIIAKSSISKDSLFKRIIKKISRK